MVQQLYDLAFIITITEHFLESFLIQLPFQFTIKAWDLFGVSKWLQALFYPFKYFSEFHYIQLLQAI